MAGLLYTAAQAGYHYHEYLLRTRPIQLDTTRAALIGGASHVLGGGNPPFVLVEFADYQCPPCIATSRLIPAVLKRYEGRLGFVFRNYPLVGLHPDALNSAAFAEAAGLQGRFWEANQRLFALRGHLDDASIRQTLSSLKLAANKLDADRRGAARRVVEDDLLYAKDRLRLPGTPSLVLSCPDGKVFLLRSLTQLDVFMGKK